MSSPVVNNNTLFSRFKTASQKLINNINLKIKSFNEIRNANTSKYKATNICLTLFFPIFLAAFVEMVQMKSVSKFIIFIFQKPTVFTFDILFIAIVYFALSMLFKRIYLSTLLVGVTFMTLSIIERFKYNANGNHFILTDVQVAFGGGTKTVNSLKSFAYIKITPDLVIFVLLFFAYLFAIFFFNPVIKSKFKKRIITSCTSIALIYCFISSSSIATPVYSFFEIDTTNSTNTFLLNEKFENNNFLAFLCQTTTEGLNDKVNKPDDYSINTFEQIMDEPDNTDTSQKKPNVIIIMSEAFADFREYAEEIGFDPAIYNDYQDILNDAYTSKTVVPTFGAFTCKTEFELNFGLPVKSLNDPNMPHKLLEDRQQITIPSYFNSIGYNTNYIHTFYRNFYRRDPIFMNYGYDNLYFEDNLTVDTEYYKTYISDKTIFNQIDKLIKDTDEPVFIHTTTMQNHQPYQEEGKEQFDVYLEGIQDMTHNLKAFLNDLKNCGEPTIVLFMGDHFPCFMGEDTVYNKLGVNGDNCQNFYLQRYFIWSNFDIDYNKVPNNYISTFYLPYVLIDLIDTPKTEIVQTMLDKMKELPIYTTNYDPNKPNDEDLDMITYDITLGEQYLKGETNEAN